LMVPQADDVIKIVDIPLAVANGASTLAGAAKRYSFDKRQALYYFEAAQMLGLVVRAKRKYALSLLGKQYLALGYPERKRLLIRRMLSLEVCIRILGELVICPNHSLSHRDIEGLVATRGGLSDTTIKRRVHTLLNWFRWVGQETGAFRVDSNTVNLNPQVK
jgi:hypothetical protein